MKIGLFLGRSRDTLLVLNNYFVPVLTLSVRLWLAKIFLDQGLATLFSEAVETAVMPHTETLVAITLALGFLVRLAAIPIAYLSLFVYFGDGGSTGHILCGLLAFTLIARGGGPLALDHYVFPHGARLAIPFAEKLCTFLLEIQKYVNHLLFLGLRIWMATIFLFVAGWNDLTGLVSLEAIHGVTKLHLSSVLIGILAMLLVVGLSSRAISFTLLSITLFAAVFSHGSSEYTLWSLILLSIVFAGPGSLSLDAIIDQSLRQIYPEYGGKPAFSLDGLKQVVIVGAGFGGISIAKALAKTKVHVTIIDRRNYHLFQPLLYQVATAGLSPAEIATPIRSIFSDQFNTRVVYGQVSAVDTQKQVVQVDERTIPYNYLILATGARHAYFGHEDWEVFAPGLKKIDDATNVRRRLLLAFERAENTQNEEERERLLTFVVVGAGPTGVELAGAISELARFGMESDFRSIDPAQARVVLVQSGDRILPMFPEQLSAVAQQALEDTGVEVRLGSRVTEISEQGVKIGTTRIHTGTVLWAAGVRASRAGKWLNCETDRAGRVIVNEDLSVPNHENVFVIGDTAAIKGSNGHPVPGLAPAAKQAGKYVAEVIDSIIEGNHRPGPFNYKHQGNLATIGRNAAVADFNGVHLKGKLAWWLWGIVHVFFLVGTRNRIAVILNWIWNYICYQSATRLITGSTEVTDTSPPETNTLRKQS